MASPGTAVPEQLTQQGISQSWRGVTSSADGVKLAAVANNGYLNTSTDSGLTWTSLTALGQKSWYDVASSADGSKLVAVADGKRIFTSTDSGANWTEQFGSNSNVQWRSVASSADGIKLIAAANQDRIYTSTDSGLTWTSRYNNGNWHGVASSADGTKLVAVENSGNIFTSTDSGVTWTARMTDQSRSWFSVASSADGTKLVASDYNGFLYTSIDSGVTWIARDSSRLWRLVASSSDGSQLMAAERDGLLYVSSDSGVNWTTLDSTRNWYGVAISADGAKLLASVFGGHLYTLGTAPEIAVEQPSLTDLTSGSTTDFGPVLTGGTADLQFTIRNPGSETLTGLGITIDGIDSALFTLTASPTGPLTGPAGSTTFTVRFAPMSIGLKSATLHIASNDSDENPFDIVLNGTGTVPTPEIAVEQPESTDLMTGAMTDFGSAAANSTSDLIFTIRNPGTADLTGVDVTVDGTDSALFTVTAIPDSTITPAGMTTFTVRFAPVSTGLKSATLHIASNDLDENPFDLSLTGTGTPEQMIARDSSSNWRGVASSADGVKLVAVITSGHIHTSTDSGATWTPRPLGTGPKNWYDVASSANGTKLVAVADGARIHTSIDSGATWTEQFGSNSNVQWRSVASSADGTKLIAAAKQDRIYTSTDSGLTWTVRYNNGNWNGVASSADGTKLVAVEDTGNIFTSTDSGATWTARMTDQSRNWSGVASSADGTKLVASDYSGFLYTSVDSGVTWTARDSSRLWRLVASSSDGSQLMAAERDGLLYISSDSGVTWTTLDSTRNWYGVAISADGAKRLASVYGGQLYTLGSAPEIAVEQPSLTDLTSGGTTDFGPVLTGGTADLQFTIRNPGSETLTGLGITIDGIDSALFTLTASPTGPLSGPAGSTTFTVRFAPMSIGLKSATLHIASNDSDENPFDIVLNGTGTVPTPEIAVEHPVSTDLMTGAMTDFGSAAANSTSDLIFTILNPGTADLTGLDVTIDGTDSALFTVTAIPATMVAPMDSTTFTVRFAPVSTGLKSATLHIASNDLDENPFDLSLTGTGTPEQLIAHESNRNWRGVAASADGVKLAAVTNNGYLYTSTDSGLTWTERTALGQKSWYDVASSADGAKLVAVADGKRIFTSTDSGATWTEQFGSNSNVQWRSVASSADGTKLIAAAKQDRIYTSTDSGLTWTVRYNNGNWNGVASSADGTKLVAVEDSGNIFTSTDSGANWTERMTDQSRNWSGVASSADGTKLVASAYSGFLYTSVDSGVTWTARDSSRLWRLVASSADGSQLMAAERDGLLYVSSDSGLTWTTLDSTRNWYGVAISADGAKRLASVYGGQLYTLGSAPEIAVEQPLLTDLTSGGTTDFGDVLTGGTADLQFTIRNPGTETLTGLGITIDGTDSALFTLTASPSGPLTGPAGSTTFTVRFAPMSIGLKSATLHIASNDSDENPFDIVLNGTGTVPTPEIAVEQPVSTDLMTGAMTDFGSAAANSTSDLIFTILNSGTADLTGVDVTIDGTDSALFTVTAIPDSTITPAGMTTFTVRFAPVSTGLKSATLHIASNDLDENPFDLSLTGTGTPEQMIARDSSSNWRGVASSADGVKLVAVITSGHIHTSTDSGATWTPRPLGTGPKNWYDVASSANGTKLVAVADGARIHTSIDSGATWTEQFGSNSNVQWRSVASSADGTKLIAAAKQDRIYTSTDSGITWTVRYNNGNWNGVASSADGTKLVAVEDTGNIFTSTDSGATWTARMTDQSRNWSGVASSADGTKLVASAYSGFLYTSVDSGVTWTARDSSRLWRLVASSADGSQLMAAERDGLLYVSSDSGVTWTTLDSTRNWYGVAISADGAKRLASVYGGQLYTLGSAPEIAVEQPSLTDLTSGGTTDFGPVLTGDTADLVFTIRNPGSETLTGLGITIDGIDSALFTLTASPTGPLTGPAGSTTFTVRFAPMSIGLKSATLHIASNDSDENPFDIVLNGTGTVPTPEIAVEQPVSTDLMTGAMTDFGSAAANSTTDLIFTVRNSGTADLTGVDVTIDGTDSALFTVTAIPDIVINPAGSTTFTVRFAPVSTGLKSATLHIASNDLDENPFDISLTGTGTPEQMTQQGSFQSWRGVTSSADGVKMAAVTNNGFLHTSTDSGLTWTARTALGQKSWFDVASSADGTKLVAVADGSRIFTSIDSGATWTEQSGSNSNVQWRTVASSADGTKLIAGANQDRIYTSADSGITWTVRFNSGNWNGVASSADGTKLVAVQNPGAIYTSTNSGVTWTLRDSSRNWSSVASSADGSKLVASAYGGQLYTSIDSGLTWTARDSTRNWRLVASSANGSQLIAAERDGLIYVSSDSGVNWTTLDSTRDWYGVAMSADGARLLASVFGGHLYTLGTASDVSQSGPNFVVTTLADNDDGITGIAHTSLREAINAANANADLSIISFDPTVFGSASTINLTGALPGLKSDLEIQGPSAGLTVRRDTGGDYRLIQVDSGTVVLRDLTLSNGNAIGGGGAIVNYSTLTVNNCMLLDNTASADGGGIESFGLLTVVDSVISGNTSGSGGGGIQSWSTLIVDRSIIRDNTANSGGGGIDIGASGLTLTASTISGNTALAGGGVRHLGEDLMTATDSTISGNTATGLSPSEGGGAIHLNANYGGGGPGATLDSNTITGNSAPNQSGGMRHGIWLTAGTLTMGNTILVANSTNDLDQVGGTIVSLGHNLVGLSNVSSSFVQIGDQINISSPGLGPLADNGGPTPTHALQAGSPALQAGATALMVDQRGSVRPSGTADDIGAFELVIVPGDPADVALGSLTATYDGNPHGISVTTTPSGLATTVTYDGTTTVPTNAGSYPVVATITDSGYHGSASGTLVIAKAQSNISWSPVTSIIFGTALDNAQLKAVADVPGSLIYSPAAGSVLNVGIQTLNVSFVPTDTTNYLEASGSQSLTVTKATATVSLTGLAASYDGSPRMVGFSTMPSGLNAIVTYDGGSTPPTNAGTYPISATISDANFVGSVTGSLVVAKAPSIIDWITAVPIEFGTALSATQLNATANAPGTFVYSPTAGTVLDVADQTLSVAFTPTDTANRLEATAMKSLLVTAAPVQIAFGDLTATYDGNTHAASVTTTPTGIAVNVTYDGSATVPTNAGSYAVAGTPMSDNYSGSGSATLVIAKATPVITWNPAGPFVDGEALGSSALNATADVAGTFTYTPAAGATLAEGSLNLSVDFSPTDTTNYQTANAARTITVVDGGLVIATQPADLNSLTGGSVMFSVTATGVGTLTYQWQKGGVDIVGATSAMLEITALTTGDAGSYQVIVSNGINTLTSTTAQLAVVDISGSQVVSGPGYRGGETMTISNTITYTGTFSSLGWTVLLPSDVAGVAWSFLSDAGNLGLAAPSAGTTSILEWAWGSLPPSPFSFTYTLSVPPAADGDYDLTAMLLPRSGGVQFQGLVNPSPLVLTKAPAFHTADTNGDFQIGLTELLRVIEIYNTRFGTTRTGRYKIQSGTEDGFAPDSVQSGSDPLTLSQFHAADSNRDGNLSLTELLRIIEIYNTRAGTTRTGQYHVQSGTEDGFAPGPAN